MPGNLGFMRCSKIQLCMVHSLFIVEVRVKFLAGLIFFCFKAGILMQSVVL